MKEILQGEDVIDFYARASVDFKFFVERVVKYSVGAELIEVEPFHSEWIHAFDTNQRSCIMAPRGHGKTEMLTVLFPLWKMSFNPNLEFLIVSNSMDQSKKIIQRLRTRIVENEFLAGLIPETRESSWTKTEIDTSNGCHVFCRPYSDNIRGVHVDYVLADEGQLFEDKDVYWGAIVPTTNAKKGKIMVIGTPNSETDLLADLGRSKEYFFKRYPALNEDGNPLSKRFSSQRLTSIRSEMGQFQFLREYMCQPAAQGSPAYPIELIIKGFDTSLTFNLFPSEIGEFYIGCDLAMSGSARGDYSVFTVVEKSDTEHYIVRMMKRVKGLDYKVQEKMIEQLVQTYKPKKVFIDESQFGRTFVADLKAKNIPVIPVYFTPAEKTDSLLNMRRLFEINRIVIPRGKETETLRLTDVLIQELTSMGLGESKTGQQRFTSSSLHDDTVISLALALKASDTSKRFLSVVAAVPQENRDMQAITSVFEDQSMENIGADPKFYK